MGKKINNLILPYPVGLYQPTPLPYGGIRSFMGMRLFTPSPHFRTGDFLCVFGAFMGLARIALCNNVTHIHCVLSDNRMYMRYFGG